MVAVFGQLFRQVNACLYTIISASEINNTGVTHLCPGRSAKLTISTCDLYIATINSFISAQSAGHPQGELSHRTLENIRLQKIVFISFGMPPSQQFLAFGLVKMAGKDQQCVRGCVSVCGLSSSVVA